MGKGFGKLKAVFKKKKADPNPDPAKEEAQHTTAPQVAPDEKTATPQSSVDHADDSALIVIHNNSSPAQYVPIHPSTTPPPPPLQQQAGTPQMTPVVDPSIATSKVTPAATAPAAAADPPTEKKLDEVLDEALSIDQVDVDPTNTEEVSTYSGGSAASASEEDTDTEEDERVKALLDSAAETNRNDDNKGRNKTKKSKQEEEVRDEESLSESVEEPVSPRRQRRSQRQRHRASITSTESAESDLNQQSMESTSLTSSYSEDIIDNRASYDTDSSSFKRTPAVENVKRRNEKSMHKDIMSHGPGATSAMMVRAMYYVPLPREEGDVVIEVEASTVSFRDCLLRRGLGVYKAPFPYVPGCETVGTITSLGKAAKLQGLRVGDRVLALHRHGGGNAKYARYDYKNLTPLTSNIDGADAACLGEVYMTAYQALRMGRKDGTPLTGSNVLITDGYSPVGQAAIALAKNEGANVYVTITDSNQEKHVESLGVKVLPINPSKWLSKVKGMMDIVIDNTCFDSYDSSWKSLNKRGVLICTGMSSLYNLRDYGLGNECGCGAFGDTRDIEAKWMRMKAKYMMSQTKFYDLWEQFEKDPKMYEQELKYLCFLVEQGRITPKIAEKVTIEEVPDAQRYLETGKANGSIVCLP